MTNLNNTKGILLVLQEDEKMKGKTPLLLARGRQTVK